MGRREGCASAAPRPPGGRAGPGPRRGVLEERSPPPQPWNCAAPDRPPLRAGGRRRGSRGLGEARAPGDPPRPGRARGALRPGDGRRSPVRHAGGDSRGVGDEPDMDRLRDGLLRDVDGSCPAGPSTGSVRVRRGGFWFTRGEFCRSATRLDFIPSTSYGYIDFRVVKSAN